MNWTEWIDAGSASLRRFRYDAASQILAVEFNYGGTYQYFDVPEHVFEQLKGSSSKGQFLAQTIKGAYRYARA